MFRSKTSTKCWPSTMWRLSVHDTLCDDFVVPESIRPLQGGDLPREGPTEGLATLRHFLCKSRSHHDYNPTLPYSSQSQPLAPKDYNPDLHRKCRSLAPWRILYFYLPLQSWSTERKKCENTNEDTRLYIVIEFWGSGGVKRPEDGLMGFALKGFTLKGFFFWRAGEGGRQVQIKRKLHSKIKFLM